MFTWQSAGHLGIDGLTQVELPIPEPGNKELLVKVKAAALNYSDILMISDKYQIKPPRPFTPGQEVAGIIIEVGEGSSLNIGRRIASKINWGGFAEYAIVRNDMVIAIPESIPFTEAVTLPVAYTTAMVALTQTANLQAGDSVLIHAAAGGVGLAAVQIARHIGASIFATAGSDEKCRLAEEQGADLAINYRHQDWRSMILDATEGKGVNVILDSVGGDITLESLRCLSWQGELLIVGFSSGEIPEIPAHRLLLKRASSKGVYWNHDRNQSMLDTIGCQLVEMYQSSVIRPIKQDHYGFKDLPHALWDLSNRNSVGKLVVKVGE